MPTRSLQGPDVWCKREEKGDGALVNASIIFVEDDVDGAARRSFEPILQCRRVLRHADLPP